MIKIIMLSTIKTIPHSKINLLFIVTIRCVPTMSD